MKRIKSIISTDSEDDKIDLTQTIDLSQPLKKESGNKKTNKGTKKIKEDQNQLSIEASFKKVITSKRKGDANTDNDIIKKTKLNKLITDNFPSTKNINVSGKVLASTSSSASSVKSTSKMTSTNLNNDQKVKKTESELKAVPASSNKLSTGSETSISSHVSSKSKAAYFQFLKRSGPTSVGSKEIPEGSPNCLAGMTFVITGVLDSIERDDAQTLIERYGGKVTKAVSGRTTYLVVGKDPGNSKLDKAKNLKTKQINEDELFYLIRSAPSKSSNNSQSVATSKKSKPTVKESKAPKRNIFGVTEKSKHKSVTVPTQSETKKSSVVSKDPIILKQEQTTKGSSNTSLFVDKYRPKSLKDVVGQQGDRSAANKLLIWLKNFDMNLKADNKGDEEGVQFRAALLSGPPGVGKTTTARLVCEQLGYDIVELNASSVRSKNNIKNTLSESLDMVPFFNKKGLKHCVIMDEIDGMAGNEDRGGINELIQVIKTTKHPIICICNDRQSRKLQSLVKHVYDLRYRQLTVDQMKAAIIPIVAQENIPILSDEVIQFIIKSSNYDMRQVLNNLQMWSVGKSTNETVTTDASDASKEFKLAPFDVVQKVFNHGNVKTYSEKSDLFFYDYQLAGLFVQENYPLVRPRLAKGDLGRTMKLMSLAADSIAMGDIIGTKIRTTNNWSLLPTQAMFASVIPGEYLHGSFSGRIEFPGWLGKYSRSNKNSRILSSLSSHLCLSTRGGCGHGSTIAMDYGDLLVKKLMAPLQEGDIETVLERLDNFQILKDDMDLLIEAMAWKHLANPLSTVTGQVKSMLTRAYNKSSVKVPYASVSVKKNKNISEPVVNIEGEEEEEVFEEEEEVEEDDGVKKDVMIVKKEATKSGKEGKSVGKIKEKTQKRRSKN